MAPTDGKPSGTPGPSRSINHPDESQRPARSGPPPQGQPAQWSAPRLDPQLQSLLQERVPSNDNFVIATRCSTLDGSGLLFHGDGVNMLVPFTMLDEQNQLRFGHTGKLESLDWLAVANLQKPGPDFSNPPTVTSRTSREPQPPVRSSPSRPQPVTPLVPTWAADLGGMLRVTIQLTTARVRPKTSVLVGRAVHVDPKRAQSTSSGFSFQQALHGDLLDIGSMVKVRDLSQWRCFQAVRGQMGIWRDEIKRRLKL